MKKKQNLSFLIKKLPFIKERFKLEIQRKLYKRKIKKKKCLLTNNSRSLITFFGLGRHSTKKLAYMKKLPGIQKSSW